MTPAAWDGRDAAAWRDAFAALEEHRHELADVHMRELFAEDPGRFERYSLKVAGGSGTEPSGAASPAELFIDFSKHRATDDTYRLLLDLARASGVAEARAAMFAGAKINVTEDRPVLHVALRNRGERPFLVDGVDVMPQVRAVLTKMRDFSRAVHDGTWQGFSGETITDVVNIGIGGSHLGPQMVVRALEPYAQPGIRVHFVSNVDGAALARTLAELHPATTLFLVASKTFTTQETMLNAHSARDWLLAAAEQPVTGAVSVEHRLLRGEGLRRD
ncbi:MAG TPA: hypothetical protein VFD39_06850, partial [Trueperaceae bacterium]|nr:hypothetical protein [Trueperaceae bacterium]